LRAIANSPAAHYNEFPKWKDAAKTQFRTIRNPKDELKAIQRLIKDRVFGGIEFGEEVQGGVTDRSPRTNAEQHLGAQTLVTVDVKKFYDNVDHRAVFRTLREFGYSTEVASLLTKLTTRNGLLPQGAPTSPLLANLVLLRAVDAPTREQAEGAGTKYTRFVDDIGISGERPAELIGGIARRLSSRGLSIHRDAKKLKVMPRSVPQKITGLNINSGKPTVPRQYRENVRAAMHQLAATSDPKARGQLARKISGRIAYVRQFHPQSAAKMAAALARVTE
jgi:hypothetical protein